MYFHNKTSTQFRETRIHLTGRGVKHVHFPSEHSSTSYVVQLETALSRIDSNVYGLQSIRVFWEPIERRISRQVYTPCFVTLSYVVSLGDTRRLLATPHIITPIHFTSILRHFLGQVMSRLDKLHVHVLRPVRSARQLRLL